ncbi:patatin family protein [Heterostelium album PN500]|uniref:Patatin family protein n=1 Tax=Heterostelium pallidum (strain ATCC 26659 / Pp 5 / PN500) TaxID=670386 RepID=D3BTU7_HETP5|nr:patatin family protein [Heterostelium album PN500]EFA75133.1 patatin family protein [Heterostelium album PN500]|eukprot:XP_020427267.1 patatin family protein [Heterostelium album PN500]
MYEKIMNNIEEPITPTESTTTTNETTPTTTEIPTTDQNHLDFKIPNCETSGCEKQSLKYCLKCVKYLCETHDSVHKKIPTMKSHTREDSGKVAKFKFRLECPDHTQDVSNDLKTKFIYICPKTRGLKFGQKLADVSKHGDKPYHQVSFIGPSGCGKSTMIRLLADDKILPTPAVKGAVDPTSSDINAYLSHLDDQNDEFIYVDSEGTGGSMSNTMLLSSLSEAKESSPAGADPKEEVSQVYDEEMNQFIAAREPFVSKSFPRLLYLFSDVLVFMFTGEARERQTVLESLILYGSSASAASVNQSIHPHLVIVFNNSNTTNKDDFDIDKATEQYLDNQSENTHKLKCLYQSISVVYVPNANGSTLLTAQQQIEKLGDLIKQKLRINKSTKESKPEYSRSKVLEYIDKAMTSFNHDRNSKIDFFKLVTMNDQNTSISSNIFKFANLVFEYYGEKSEDIHKSFSEANEILENAVIVSYKHYCKRISGIDPRIGQPDAQFIGAFVDILNQVEEKLQEFKLCGSTYYSENLKKHVLCQSRKNSHGSKHESTEVVSLELSKEQADFLRTVGIKNGNNKKITWSGEFENSLQSGTLAERCQRALRSPKTVFKTADWESGHLSKYSNFWSICNVCLLDFPSEVRNQCEHFVCYQCCKESPLFCPICKKHSIWVDRSIPENAALRVLCLEGGGLLFSASQSTVIDEIEKRLYGIPISRLFDMVSGIGTGALIGLVFLCGNKKLSTVIEMIDRFSDQTHGMLKLLGNLEKEDKNFSMDKMTSLLFQVTSESLSGYIPNANIFTTPMDCKFICSTVSKNLINPNIAQAGNYNAPLQVRVDSLSRMSTALLIDSDLHDTKHHPIKFTIGECERYWGINQKDGLVKSKQIDLVASIGNGSISITPDSDANEEWQSHISKYSQSISKMFRIDTVLPDEIFKTGKKSEIVSSISNETRKYLNTKQETKEELKILVNNLIAQLFFVQVNPRIANTKTVTGIIRCRLPNNQIPNEIISQIQSSSKPFSLSDHSGLPDDFQFTFNIDSIKYEPTLEIPFSIDNVEIYNSFNISIQCNLKCKDSDQPIQSINFELSN